MIHDLARAIDMGFRRIASGSPATLEAAKVKPLVHNALTGNSVRTITIDGTEYVVPDGVTLLESIAATGTQYIDTGISPAGKKIGAVIDFQYTDTSRTNGGVFGSNKSDGTDNCQFTVYNSKWRIKLNNYATYGATYNTVRHTARCNMPDGTSLDSTVYTTTQYTIASVNTNNVYVGACNYGSSSTETYTLIGKLYSAKVYDDTTLVRNFVPAKNSSNEVGMYDFVTGQFFTNAGTGSFTAGAELPTPEQPLGVKSCGEKYINIFGAHYPVPKGVKLLEYIDISNGKIDTGIQANPAYTNTRMRVCMTQLSGTTALFGARGGTSSSTRSYNIFGAVSGTSGRFDNVNPSQNYVFTVNRWCDIELGHNKLKGTVTIDGTLLCTGTQNMADEDLGNIYIGSLNNNGTDFGTRTPAKWGTVSILANGVDLSAVLHPAQMGTQVGMYDFIRKTFIAVDGTVSAGPEATLEYKLTERVSGNLYDVSETAVGSIAELQAITKPTKSRANATTAGTVGIPMAWTANAKGIVIPCSKGDTFTIKIFGTIGTGRKYYVECDADGNLLTTRASYSGLSEKTITTSQDGCAYLFIEWSIDETDEAEVVVVKGSTAPTAYTPYFAPQTVTAYTDKPLGKVGTYADTFDFATGGHVDGVGVKVFDGTENWMAHAGIANWFYAVNAVSDIVNTDADELFCSNYTFRLNVVNLVDGEFSIGMGSNHGRAVFKDVRFTTTEEWKAFLAAQYAAGTPVTIWYPLATPVTTQHTAVPVTPAQGTNYVESTNAVKGAVTAEYRSRGAS